VREERPRGKKGVHPGSSGADATRSTVDERRYERCRCAVASLSLTVAASCQARWWENRRSTTSARLR
jgi:hypothetical protein